MSITARWPSESGITAQQRPAGEEPEHSGPTDAGGRRCGPAGCQATRRGRKTSGGAPACPGPGRGNARPSEAQAAGAHVASVGKAQVPSETDVHGHSGSL